MGEAICSLYQLSARLRKLNLVAGSPSYVITLFRLHHFEVLPLYGNSGTELAALTRNHGCR